MPLQTVTPDQAKTMLNNGAILIDVREADEHARAHIANSRNLPLSQINEAGVALHGSKSVIFFCRSGARTQAYAAPLSACVGGQRDAYAIEGGLDAWRKAGLPVVTDRRQPLELQRQVQIGAGSMALLGTILGAAVSPWFFLVPGFVGAGLLFAGATGFCGLARLLMHAPWNRPTFRSHRT